MTPASRPLPLLWNFYLLLWKKAKWGWGKAEARVPLTSQTIRNLFWFNSHTVSNTQVIDCRRGSWVGVHSLGLNWQIDLVNLIGFLHTFFTLWHYILVTYVFWLSQSYSCHKEFWFQTETVPCCTYIFHLVCQHPWQFLRVCQMPHSCPSLPIVVPIQAPACWGCRW